VLDPARRPARDGVAHWDPARPDELRVQRESEELIQRREAVRVDAVVPGLLIAVEGQSARAATTTVNVSGTGLLVRDPARPRHRRARPARARARGRRAPRGRRGPGRPRRRRRSQGLQFEAVSRGDQDRLARFIAERQRPSCDRPALMAKDKKRRRTRPRRGRAKRRTPPSASPPTRARAPRSAACAAGGARAFVVCLFLSLRAGAPAFDAVARASPPASPPSSPCGRRVLVCGT
jgi:hypothetical protein